jgi:hypothetical protein
MAGKATHFLKKKRAPGDTGNQQPISPSQQDDRRFLAGKNSFVAIEIGSQRRSLSAEVLEYLRPTLQRARLQRDSFSRAPNVDAEFTG